MEYVFCDIPITHCCGMEGVGVCGEEAAAAVDVVVVVVVVVIVVDDDDVL